MGISRATTEKVKERADIEDVVNDYVPLKKKGQNLWACCPFHNEKSPSFSVSPAKQIYKCFGCGKAGDPIQFVMDIEGVGFNEAIRHLAQKYGIEVEEDKEQTPEAVQAHNERESLYIALGYARDFFVKSLHSEEGKSIGLSYFKERGFNQNIIEKFDLGYALNGWSHLHEAAKADGFSDEILLKSGLILQKEGDPQRLYDRFRGRVIFTIHNLGGKPVGFGARILTQDKKQPKYINSPETEVYHKSDILYGIFQAKKSIREKDNCYLVEGYTDVISMHLAGIENVVASSGTSLTESQIKLIKRFSDNITVLYDGDAAGIKASLRGIDMILEGGLNVKAVVFPNGEDPDSYARKVGSSAFKDYLESKAQDFISFKIGLYAEETANDPIKQANLIKEVVQSLGKIPDPIIRTVYIRKSADLLGIDEDIIQAELNKIYLKGKKDQYFKEQQQTQETPIEDLLIASKEPTISDKLQLQEREMLRLLVNYGFEKVSDELHVCEYLLQETEDLKFETPVYQKILKMYQEALSQNILPQPDFFLHHDDSEVKKEAINLITRKYELSTLWESRFQIFTSNEADDLAKTVYDSILHLKKKVVKKLMEEAKVKIKEVEEENLTEDILNERLSVYMELKNYQVEIDRQLGIVISF
ncbi:DNA primase [Indibacter alkaliphilus LW1]|jgi:DNA primase|uniref:DNA primase n=1 Tax=Indibacter alkaliphilus (strain CCUG 57479 / KCTC 22604 / LW1) TaxID=1189612 RepID=S2DM86_INDAL|nr:DNA primase [Indibacter alkaliphilus]EOZ98315.1 DNA primase [Indibacter alkaliphilus LW1]